MQTVFKQLFLDFLSAIVFLIVYAVTDNLMLATGIAVAVSIAQFVYARVTGQRIEPMQWLVLGLVIVLGAATLISHDSRFIMAKPSIVHAAIGTVMLRRGWMLRYLPPIAIQRVPADVIIRFGYAWAALMFTLAIANVVIAVSFDFKVWAWFIAFGAMGAKIVFFIIQYVSMRIIGKRNRPATA